MYFLGAFLKVPRAGASPKQVFNFYILQFNVHIAYKKSPLNNKYSLYFPYSAGIPGLSIEMYCVTLIPATA